MIHVLLLAISWLFRCLTINHLLSLQSIMFDFWPEFDNSGWTITMSVISTCDHWENPPPVHVSSRMGEASNKKQTDLVSGLFKTAIQMISKDLRITFTTLKSLRAIIRHLYQAQDIATVRLFLKGITEDCIDVAINQLPFCHFIRVWCHPNVDFAILTLYNTGLLARSHKQNFFCLHRNCREWLTKTLSKFYQRGGIYQVLHSRPTQQKRRWGNQMPDQSRPWQLAKCYARSWVFGTAVPALYRRKMVVDR